MKKISRELLSVLLAVLLLVAQPVSAGALEDGGAVTLTDQQTLVDSFESVQLTVQSYESTANGTGSLYSGLSTRQKAAYKALENISWSRIISSGGNTVPVSVQGINGTVLSGMNSGGTFVPTGSSVTEYRNIQNDVNVAITALRYDRPDLIWLDASVGSYYNFRGTGGRYVITQFSFYFSLPYGGQENTMRDRMMEAARSIANEASRQPDTYSRVKRAHDLIAARSTYNNGAASRPGSSSMGDRLAHNAYSALIGGDSFEPVCDGYSKAFKIVLNLMDIPCTVAISHNHMWNNVKMDDGLWYNVDLTWDDGGNNGSLDYFLVGSGTVIWGTAFSAQQDHIERDPFNENTVSGARYPRKNTVAYKYTGADYPKTTYPDVPRSDYAYEYIEKVSKLGYFSGDNAGYFNPGKNITRVEFATVLAKAMGVDLEAYKGMYSFSDVGTTKWYSGAAYWAKESGLMVGSGDRFRPEAPISRQEMCTVLARALDLDSVQSGIFADDKSIDSWAREGVYACYAAGLVTGNNGSFNPKKNTVRRDAAIVFSKYAERVGAVPSGGQ